MRKPFCPTCLGTKVQQSPNPHDFSVGVGDCFTCKYNNKFREIKNVYLWAARLRKMSLEQKQKLRDEGMKALQS